MPADMHPLPGQPIASHCLSSGYLGTLNDELAESSDYFNASMNDNLEQIDFKGFESIQERHKQWFTQGRVFKICCHKGEELGNSYVVGRGGELGSAKAWGYRCTARAPSSGSIIDRHTHHVLDMIRKLQSDSNKRVDIIVSVPTRWESTHSSTSKANFERRIGSRSGRNKEEWSNLLDTHADAESQHSGTSNYAKKDVPERLWQRLRSQLGLITEQNSMKTCCEKLLSFLKSDRDDSLHVEGLISCVLNSARPLRLSEVQAMIRFWNKNYLHDITHVPSLERVSTFISATNSVFDLNSHDQITFRDPEMYKFFRNFGIDGIDSSHTTLSNLCCDILRYEHDWKLEASIFSALEPYALDFGLFHSITVAGTALGLGNGLADLIGLSNRTAIQTVDESVASVTSCDLLGHIEYVYGDDGHGIGYTAEVLGSDGAGWGSYVRQSNVSLQLNALRDHKCQLTTSPDWDTQVAGRARL